MSFKGAQEFRVAKYCFELMAKEEIKLPQYKGSTFRGAFGSLLKRICCSNWGAESCTGCLLRSTCPYAYIFETGQHPENTKIKRLKDTPRPFVLEPPLDPKMTLQRDEIFSFGLVLIGRAINLLPYFLLTFKELGSVGIGISGSGGCSYDQLRAGRLKSENVQAERVKVYKRQGYKKRGQFLLEKVKAVSSDGFQRAIYTCEDQMVKNLDLSFTLSDLTNFSEDQQVTHCTLRFITPARIKSKGTFGSDLNFHSLFSRLIERIQALSIFHCEKPLEIDHRSLKELAENIETESSSLRFVDWARYSSRQKTRMLLGGYTGEITFKGDLMPFLPFLRLGQYVHVGKNPTFGLGQYTILI